MLSWSISSLISIRWFEWSRDWHIDGVTCHISIEGLVSTNLQIMCIKIWWQSDHKSSRYLSFSEESFDISKIVVKNEFRTLIKHRYLMGKILLKLKVGLKNDTRILLRRKLPFVTGLLNSNVVIETQMVLNALGAQIKLLRRKT